jgi:hypothetical protein
MMILGHAIRLQRVSCGSLDGERDPWRVNPFIVRVQLQSCLGEKKKKSRKPLQTYITPSILGK